jgi:SAM-dependent methyltransferase
METAAFLNKVLNDWGATFATLLAALGDRLGLFAALAPEPATAEELAVRVGLDQRYVAEWLAGLTAAGYLTHDPATDRFALPREHAVALAQEGSMLCVGGGYQNLLGLLGVLDQVTDAFRTGEGVPYAEYPIDTFDGMARITGAAHDNVLVPMWLPKVPDVVNALSAGARLVDVGCGQGRAVIAMARAFPRSSFFGLDGHRLNVERAGAHAGALQLGDRVKFEVGDALNGIAGGPFDIACMLDVLHDSADPVGLLRATKAALVDGGALLLLEPNTQPEVEGNNGPLGTMHYGISVLYCMSVSLATGGPGLGTCGTSEPVVRALCADAGFSSVDEVPIDNLFNRLYLVR